MECYEQNKETLKKLLCELYGEEQLTDSQFSKLDKQTEVEELYEDLHFAFFMSDGPVDYFSIYSIKNNEGKNALVKIYKTFSIRDSKKNRVINGYKVLLPFSDKTYAHELLDYITVQDNITKKKGLYNYVKENWFLKEVYDDIQRFEHIEGMKISKNGKVGRIFPPKYKTHNIPAKYDEIICGFSVDSTVFVKKDGKIGAYCYNSNAHHYRYLSEEDRTIKYKYVDKSFIKPLFDEIEEIESFNNNSKYLKVTLENKEGVIEAFSKRFVVPIIFDTIERLEIEDIEKVICYGKITNEDYIYNGQELMKFQKTEPEFSESYQKVLTKIKPRKEKDFI